MNVLITGATGFLGRYLVERLHKKHSLKIIARSREKSAFAEKIGVKAYHGDILDNDILQEACGGVDTVIHLAATFELKKAVEENVTAMDNIISSCRDKNVKKLIFMSSLNSRFKKQGPYSLSKKICEEKLAKSDLDYVILRPTIIYDDNGGVFFSRLLKLIKRFHVAPIIGTGEYLIQPIHVNDVVSVVEKTLLANKQKSYDLVGPDIFTYKRLADMMYEKLGIAHKIKIYLPLWFLKFAGSFIGIQRDKILEIAEDKTGDPEIIKREFNIPLIRMESRLDLMIRSIS